MRLACLGLMVEAWERGSVGGSVEGAWLGAWLARLWYWYVCLSETKIGNAGPSIIAAIVFMVATVAVLFLLLLLHLSIS